MITLKEFGWPTAEHMVGAVLNVYSTHIGSVSALSEELQIDLGRAERDDLEQIYTEAVARLAHHASALEGLPKIRLSDWRVILYGLDGGRSLRDAILRICDCFEALDGRWGYLELDERNGLAYMRLSSLRKHQDRINCMVDFCGIAQLQSQMSWLIGTQIPVRELALDYPVEIYESLQLPHIPFPLNHESCWTGFVFPAPLLDRPVVRGAGDRERHGGPAGFMFLGGQDLSADLPFAYRIRAMVLQTLRDEHRLPSFDKFVQYFASSRATLRRRLAHEGTSYREIRDSCRRELALDLLCRTNHSIESIATMLDFCDSDAFRSAFSTWVDETPTAYRRRMLVEITDPDD